MARKKADKDRIVELEEALRAYVEGTRMYVYKPEGLVQQAIRALNPNK